MDDSLKRKHFEEKAYKRVNKIIDGINILPFFANREFYDYSALEVLELFSKIESALNKARDKYIYELQREEKYISKDEEEYEDEE